MSTITQRDHISNLPNDVLSHILSRLPVKDAVRTSVLSKDWEFKWTSIYDVDIDSFSLELKDEETFVNIAEQVLLHVMSVRKCRLICICLVENELSRITMLLSTILRWNVKCLEVDIFNTEDFVLPRSLLTCATLTKLSLCFEEPCSLRVPTDNCFPNMKHFSLAGVKILNCISNTDTIVFTFPVLKLLRLTTCKWVDVKFVKIYAPTLCKVTSITPYEWDDKKDLDYSIKIIGSMVDELNINGGYPENISVSGSSVISKDWEFKWTSISNVDIDIEKFSPESRNERTFVTIAVRVLLHVLDVKKCSLMCTSPVEYELSRIAGLVSAVLRRNVKHLELDICNTQGFFLPRSLLNCASLTKLILVFETPCSFRVPAKIFFPKLKYLCFQRVMILNDLSSTDTLIFNFPVLKALELIHCKWIKVKFVEIHAPLLSMLTSLPQSKGNVSKDFDYSIKIIGTVLAVLCIDHQEKITMSGSNVVRTNLECRCDQQLLSLEDRGLQVRKILREIPNLKYLAISDLWAIGQTKRLPLPRFHQLRSLHLILRTPFDAEGVLELLHATPFLKSLIICLADSEDSDYDSVENIPSCVVHQLEEVSVVYTFCPEPNFLLEKFLLKNGAHLKTVNVLNRLEVRKLTGNEIVEKLSTFPKASALLEIVSSSTVLRD